MLKDLIKSEHSSFYFLLGLIVLAFFLTFPILSAIPSHPDEHQFLLNAWSIMGGKQLHNFLHVALTEYALTTFFFLANVLTPSGVNFPQGDPSLVTYYFARVFGLILYFSTYFLGLLLLQSGQRKVRVRSLIFTILFFASPGVFERFLRVNSDSMSIFVTLNYVYLSVYFWQKKYSIFRFFWLDLTFVFLGSFTNFKTLYMVLPIAIFNLVRRHFLLSDKSRSGGELAHRLYRFFFTVIGIVAGSVFLWYVFIPKPVDPHVFWYNLKNATVRGVGYDFEYPSQSYNSWAFYIYDFFVEYLGLGQLLAILILVSCALFIKRGINFSDFKSEIKARGKTLIEKIEEWDYLTLFLVFLVIIFYYLGVAKTLVHWSRWGAPLGVFGFLALSPWLEELINFLSRQKRKNFFNPIPIFLVTFILAWILRISMVVDLLKTNFPLADGFSQTVANIDKFVKEKGISPADQKKEISWFTGNTSNVGSLSLEGLVDPGGDKIKYVLWPYWNIGLLYTPNNVDKFTSNQRAFINKYAQSVDFRLPSLMSQYMHYTKYFAWHYLGLTWNPEMDSLVETQFGVVQLKKIEAPLSFNYVVGESDLSHYYSPYSLTFNYKNLPDTYVFPTCATNPDVRRVNSGEAVPPPPGLSLNGIGGKTAGLNCHSLWFRVFLRGRYLIKIEGLPLDLTDRQMVYSTQPFIWDPPSRTLYTAIDQTLISAEFGVATKEKYLPDLKFLVYYESVPKPKEASESAEAKK